VSPRFVQKPSHHLSLLGRRAREVRSHHGFALPLSVAARSIVFGASRYRFDHKDVVDQRQRFGLHERTVRLAQPASFGERVPNFPEGDFVGLDRGGRVG